MFFFSSRFKICFVSPKMVDSRNATSSTFRHTPFFSIFINKSSVTSFLSIFIDSMNVSFESDLEKNFAFNCFHHEKGLLFSLMKIQLLTIFVLSVDNLPSTSTKKKNKSNREYSPLSA